MGGRLLQIIYVLKRQDEDEFESVDPLDWATLQGMTDIKSVRIIHAMDLTPEMKRQLRRRRR